MTEDSQSRMRGYGPFPEGAEPTEQIAAQDDAAQPTETITPVSSGAPRIPVQRSADVHEAGAPGPSDQPRQVGDARRTADGLPRHPGMGDQPMSSAPQPPYSDLQPPSGQPHPTNPPATAAPDTPATAAPHSPATAVPHSPATAVPHSPATAAPHNPTSVAPNTPATAAPYPADPSSPPPYAPASGAPYYSSNDDTTRPFGESGSGSGDDGGGGWTTPTPGTPQTPYSVAQPTSGTPHSPYSDAQGAGAPATPPNPISADPYAPDPAPISSSPYPTSGGPSYGPFRAFDEQEERAPQVQAPKEADPDPYGFVPPPGRRIEPSPPPDRSRLFLGMVAGLTAGLLLFGTAGWFAGRATAPTSSATATAQPPAPANTSQQLGVFEQNQVAINRPDFAGTGLTAISEGWLPYLATCTRNGTPGGPALNAGEKNRVRCTLDGMSAIFVEYNSVADRDKARVKALGQAVDARSLTPGVAAASERPTPSGRTTGNYVEYAYRLTERGTTRTVSGIWWDDARTPVAGYLLAYWKDGVGESWEPMRDLWSRYA